MINGKKYMLFAMAAVLGWLTWDWVRVLADWIFALGFETNPQ